MRNILGAILWLTTIAVAQKTDVPNAKAIPGTVEIRAGATALTYGKQLVKCSTFDWPSHEAKECKLGEGVTLDDVITFYVQQMDCTPRRVLQNHKPQENRK